MACRRVRAAGEEASHIRRITDARWGLALPTGISEYYNNRWEVALPVYSLALMDGFGRMGNDAHWFSETW